MTGDVRACIALGSNLGDRDATLRRALAALVQTPGITRVVASSFYETDPVGPPPQGFYLNAAASLRTSLSARALLDRLLAIETAEGRVRNGDRNAARTLDLDLLLYGDAKVDEPGLSIPHPRLQDRAFVLEPLSEIAGELLHPVLHRTLAALAAEVRDPHAVRRVAGTGGPSRKRHRTATRPYAGDR